MFKLSPSALAEYRALTFSHDARLEISLLPLGTLVWEDEHPGGKCMLPDLDDVSWKSMILLVGARTALWLDGEVPEHLQPAWDEAMLVLPDWPGFRRLTITDDQRDDVRFAQKELDAFEESLFGDADSFSRTKDGTGIVEINATFDLTKEGPNLLGDLEDDD